MCPHQMSKASLEGERHGRYITDLDAASCPWNDTRLEASTPADEFLRTRASVFPSATRDA